MPGKNAVSRPNPSPFEPLKQFIGVCAKARKDFDPETIKANVGHALGEFLGGMDDDSKALVNDVARLFRRPK